MKNTETLNPDASAWQPSLQLPLPPPPPFPLPPLIPVYIQPPPPPPFLPRYSYIVYPQPQPIFTSTSPAPITDEQETGESSRGHSGRRRRRSLPPRHQKALMKARAAKPPVPDHSAAASISSQVPVSHPRPKLKKQEWRPKLSGAAASLPVPPPLKTTLMIRNIPSKIRRDFMLKFLDSYCKKHSLEYDFFYLPIDFRRLGNLGYCFVNLTTPAAAMKLKQTLTNYKWREAIVSNKVCEVSWARIQGKEKMIQTYEKSVFKCDDPDFLPVIFEPPRNGSERNPPAPVTVGTIRR